MCTCCGEDKALMYGPVNVVFHKVIYYVAFKKLKVQDNDIEDFANL